MSHLYIFPLGCVVILFHCIDFTVRIVSENQPKSESKSDIDLNLTHMSCARGPHV